MFRSTILCLIVAIISGASAFMPAHQQVSRSMAVNMAPKFDPTSQQWIPTDEDESTSAYGPIGSLVRAGPLPFFQRIFNADEYEQAVLKYMAQDGCDRKEAQGNMDAYLENPNDWAYQKMCEKNGSAKKDYANANTSPKQLVLSGLWAAVVFYFAFDLISGYATGKYGFVNLFDLPNPDASLKSVFSFSPF